jgi:hypothetical protein
MLAPGAIVKQLLRIFLRPPGAADGKTGRLNTRGPAGRIAQH